LTGKIRSNHKFSQYLEFTVNWQGKSTRDSDNVFITAEAAKKTTYILLHLLNKCAPLQFSCNKVLHLTENEQNGNKYCAKKSLNDEHFFLFSMLEIGTTIIHPIKFRLEDAQRSM
jgi:hypothetical protein